MPKPSQRHSTNFVSPCGGRHKRKGCSQHAWKIFDSSEEVAHQDFTKTGLLGHQQVTASWGRPDSPCRLQRCLELGRACCQAPPGRSRSARQGFGARRQGAGKAARSWGVGAAKVRCPRQPASRKVAQSWGGGALRGRFPQPAAAREAARSWGAQAWRGRSPGQAQLWGTFLPTPGPALRGQWAQQRSRDPDQAWSWGAQAWRGRSLGQAQLWRPFLLSREPALCGH